MILLATGFYLMKKKNYEIGKYASGSIFRSHNKIDKKKCKKWIDRNMTGIKHVFLSDTLKKFQKNLIRSNSPGYRMHYDRFP